MLRFKKFGLKHGRSLMLLGTVAAFVVAAGADRKFV